MNQKVKTSFGQTKNGRPFRAVVMLVLLWSFLVPACEAGVLPKMPAACFTFMADSLGNGNAGWYALGAVLSGLAVALAVRWAYRWRQRVLQQRDDEIFQLIDEWTKSLQQEVAERKQAQRALQESHELITRQERLAAVGQLTAGLAHEFNNIMTIVQGHASLLMDNPGLDEDSVNSLGHITDGVDRMAKLVRQMLAFSRKQVMQLKALDLSGTVAGTSIMLGGVLGERVALRLEAAPQLPPVMADPDMVQQVMVNLAVNARDAMPDGGELTIRTSEANFAATDVPAQSERKAGRFVRLSVTDTGSGMEPGTIKHLFEPFFTTKEVGKGPGLGLATVYGIVSQHQGWIEVQSKVELGTTFDLYFPVTDQMPERPVKQEAPPEALETWEEHRDKVDLLLTDIAMPHGLSGRDLAIKLRKDAPQLPVIFSSGYSQEMIERNDGADQGATFLSKPYNPVQLAHSVRHALDAAAQREHQMAANAPQPVERP